MTKQRLIPAVLLAALLSGCSMIPDFSRPEVETPAAWSEQTASEPTKVALDWWKNFNSAELNTLMIQALQNNNDINAAIQRVEQSRATLRVTNAAFLPQVDANGSVGYDKINVPNGRDTNDSTGRAGVGISYELDIFGRNRALSAADEADFRGSQFDRDAIALIVMGDVAQTYFNVLNLEERLRISDANLQSSRELLRIVQARYDAGATTLLDVSQQKSDLASNEANRALIEQQVKIARSALAVLMGRAPQGFTVVEKDLRSLPVPVVSPGQPSTLLERRPDIRRAEEALIAANADIGAARAAFFPNITLGLNAGIAAIPLGDPVTTTITAASSLLAPIFSGGRLEGNLQRTKARQAELVENYRKTVLVSFKEVEDALATVTASSTRETSLETAMNEARNAFNLSQQQYDAGAIDFQILLDARRTMLTAEDLYVQTKNERLAAAVDLFKALGGGWTQELSSGATAAKTYVRPLSNPVENQSTPAPVTPATTVPTTSAPQATPTPLAPVTTSPGII